MASRLFKPAPFIPPPNKVCNEENPTLGMTQDESDAYWAAEDSKALDAVLAKTPLNILQLWQGLLEASKEPTPPTRPSARLQAKALLKKS